MTRRSASTIAQSGNIVSPLTLILACRSSTVSTETQVTSEPVPQVVGTARKGRGFSV